MRRSRLGWTWVLALSVAVAGLDLVSAGPAVALGILPPANPAANLALSPAAATACEGSASNSSASCESAALSQIDSARADEGVGPMVLPGDYLSLGVPEQLLVVIALERSARGLAVPSGLVSSYNSDAQIGADATTDPAPPPGYASYGSIEAQGVDSVLLTDYEWMYDDGYGSANADCPSPSSSGCWVHRDIILGDYSATPYFYMGGAQASNGAPVYTAVLVASSQAQAVVYAYEPSNPIALNRLGGANRDLTSVAVSQNSFPGGQSAKAVVLATDADYPDALAGTPLAVAADAPMLLSTPATLDPAVASEIQRVLAPGGTVYLLGGSAALSPVVSTQVQQLGYKVVREAGANRFGTAIAIAGALGDPSTVFVADGTEFADALIAGPAAAMVHGAILLSNGDSMPAASAAYLGAQSGSQYAIGAGAQVADPQAQALGGSDAYSTSVAVTQAFFGSASIAGFASEASYPDELSGGAHIGALGGPIILAPASGALPTSISTYLSSSAITSGWLYGGTVAVSPGVQSEIASS